MSDAPPLPESGTVPDALAHAPPSTHTVFLVARAASTPLTYADLCERCDLAHGTVSRSCQQIVARGLGEFIRTPASPTRKLLHVDAERGDGGQSDE